MEDDRKYRQRGYQDNPQSSSTGIGQRREERPRQQGPRLPLDVTGPRLPRLVQSIVASRCHNCSTTLSATVDFKGNCPKCNAALHCCKQCTNFEPSTRFQCLKPIPVRIALKDQMNECEFFNPRVTVARDAAPASNAAAAQINTPQPRSSNDARAAFDSLFKK
jgi:hypothetical protein